ncbi:hypothetical protein NMG60_11021156 [Bertholletia excelsa]
MYMAMSETVSSTTPGDSWAQFYSGRTAPAAMLGDRLSDATVVTTMASSGTASPRDALSPEGRVSKPIRRRSRASRRTPTTLLNTDTSNFRAMVQQFTGGPSGPFPAGSHPYSAPSNFNYGLGTRPLIVNPAGAGGYNLLRFQQPQEHLQPQPFMFSVNNSDGFAQRINSQGGFPRPPSDASNEDTNISGGFNNYLL